MKSMFKKGLSLFLVLLFVIGLVPVFSKNALATDSGDKITDVSDDGKYSLTLDKTTFKKGEPIMVTAVADAMESWVGICPKGAGTYPAYYYIGKGGSGAPYNIIHGQVFEPGEYDIYLVLKRNGGYGNRVAMITVTITDEEYDGAEIYPSTNFGDPSILYTKDNQRVFKVGEPILIKATDTSPSHSYGDWLAIYSDIYDTSYDKYVYVRQTATSDGSYYDLSSIYSFKEGTYLIRSIDAVSPIVGYENNTVAGIYITVTNEEIGETEPDTPTPDPEPEPEPDPTPDPEPEPEPEPEPTPEPTGSVSVTNGTHMLSVNKTRFEEGEEILVSSVGVLAKDWIGIACRGDREATIRWYYIAGNESSYNIKNAPNLAGGSLAEKAHLPEGLYTIYLVENDQYLKNSFTLSINIAIGSVADSANGATEGGTEGPAPVIQTVAPTGATYTPIGNGYAGGTVTVTMPSAAIDTHSIIMYWANENGILEGYSAHARFKVSSESPSFTFTDSTFVPNGATKLLVYSQNNSTGELSSEFITIDLPENSAIGDLGTPTTDFFVISDIHITSSLTDTHAQHFKMMLNEAFLLNPNGMPIFIVGDIADGGAKEQYENMLTLYNEALVSAGKQASSYPLFMAIGNHDYASGTLFLEYVKLPNGESPDDTCYDFWLNGYHYIFLGSDVQSGLNAYFNEETLTWLDNTLNEHRSPARPTFVFLHQSIYNTVAGSLPGEGWNGVTNENALKAVLSKYPEVMLFNGHSHWEMNSNSNMFEGTAELPIHAFNCGSVGYLWSGYNKVTGEHMDGSHGYYVAVYGGKTLVRGRDFVNSEWISTAQYMIEQSGEAEDNHSLEIKEFTYESGFTSKGKIIKVCAVCGCTVTEEVKPLIVFLGYSFKENDSAICVGYTVESDLVAMYEAVNCVEIICGFNASVYDNLVNKNNPVNPDGTASEVVAGTNIVAIAPSTVKRVDMLLKSDSWSAYSDLKLNLCGFIIVNGKVGYLCNDTISDKTTPITYSQIAD